MLFRSVMSGVAGLGVEEMVHELFDIVAEARRLEMEAAGSGEEEYQP